LQLTNFIKMNQFKGTGVALITPFKTDKTIDFAALEKLINHCIQNGVNYFVVLGTTGETPVLSKDEKNEVWEFVAKINNNRLPLVAGMGSNNTAELIQDMQNFKFKNQYQAFLSVTPYYNKPSQAALIQHYKAVSSMSPLPIILYNVPGRTGINMLPATTLTIAAECKNVIAIKEASGSMAACFELVKNKPANFLVLSGDDDIVMPQLASGMDGVISVAAQCYTKDFCNLVNAAINQDFVTAKALHYKLIDGVNLLFKEGNPVGVKAALHQLGICENELRLPLIAASNELYAQIKTFVTSL
jgi:4-hydroxy-tetrahydrodipicolinate synthase